MNIRVGIAMPHRSIAACSIDRSAIPDSCTRTIHSTKFKFRNKYKYVCHTRLNGGTVERHASVQARTHAAAVRHRPRDLVSTLFMARFQRTAFVSQRAWRPPERECPRNCDQQGFCDSGNSPHEPEPCLKPYRLWQDKAGRGWARFARSRQASLYNIVIWQMTFEQQKIDLY